MVDLMARMCYKYHNNLPPEWPFRAFGKRDAHGDSLAHTGNLLDLPIINKMFEDLDFLINCLTRKVQQAYDITDHARAVIHAKTQELQTSEPLLAIWRNLSMIYSCRTLTKMSRLPHFRHNSTRVHHHRR